MTSVLEFDSGHRLFDEISYYFSNNIVNKSLEINDRIDPNLEIIEDISQLKLSLDNFLKIKRRNKIRHSSKGSKKSKLELSYEFSPISDIVFTFKYNDITYKLEKIIFDKTPITIDGKVELFQIIKIYYEDIKTIDTLINDIHSYYIKYKKCSEETDDNFTLYINEENYWEHLGSKQKRGLKNIYLPEKEKQSLVDDLENFLSEETKQRYTELGITYKRVYLLEGIPGSGKTSLVSALASKFDNDIGIFNFDLKTTDTVLTKMIRIIPDNCFVLFEDLDGMFAERKQGDLSKNLVTFSGLLNSLDGISTKPGLVVFITTNDKLQLDPALIRPGRVDYQMKFQHIKKKEIIKMYRAFMKKTYIEGKDEEFYSKFKELSIDISASLLQQYLFKYMDKLKESIENIEEIKSIKDMSNSSGGRDLYS